MLKTILDINTLRQIPLLAELPDTRLQWLIEQGTEVWLEPGEIHREQGDAANHVFIMLDGEVRITQKVGNQEIVLATYGAKTLFGELPLMLGDMHYWASGRAVTRCHVLELPNAAFWELLSSCTCVMKMILRTMAERVQDVQTISQNREKLVALGTLAAGLAHELNNPASANRRAAGQLRQTFQVLQPLTLQLSAQQQFLADLQQDAISRATNAVKLDPLTQSDKEDEVTDWLENYDITNAWKLAPTLVTAGIAPDWLENVKQNVGTELLSQIIAWIDATLTETELINQIEQSSDRISQLVQAVKDYSYMDQAPIQEIDIHQGLESTLTILSNKLKQGVTVTRQYDCNIPQITAHGSELNQVWTNLIDNAIDAMNGKGELTIRTSCEGDFLLVEIADNGAGIPPEIQPHIFEPFFTTKGVGKGTGLGLHIAYRVVVGQHHGDLSVTSQPGNTRFQVRLPVNL